jgi:hypothetical protein
VPLNILERSKFHALCTAEYIKGRNCLVGFDKKDKLVIKWMIKEQNMNILTELNWLSVG